MLVVGAGPAGSTAALKLAKLGIRTVVIESKDKIGKSKQLRVDITESSDIEKIVNELKLNFIAKSNRSIWFSGSDCFELKSRIYDFYFKRGPSEDSLEVSNMNKAMDDGVEVYTGTIPKFIMRRGVITEVLVKRTIIKPEIIIGADGVNSSVLNLLDIREDIKFVPGYGETFKNLKCEDLTSYIFFDLKLFREGYFYGARVNSDLGILGGGGISINPAMAFKKFIRDNHKIKEMVCGASKINSWRGAGYVSNLKRHVYDNVLLVGDAGRLADPFLLYGIRPSIISGYYGAISIKQFLSGTENLQVYERYIQDALLRDYNVARKLRSIIYRLDSDELNTIIKISREFLESGGDIENLENIFKNIGPISNIFVKNFIPTAKLFLKILPYIILN